MASSLWQKLLSCNYPRLDPFKPTDLVPLLDKLTTTATTTIYLPYHIFGGGPYFRWQWGGQAEWQQLLFAWLGMCRLWGLETEKLCQTRSAEQFLADWCLAIPFFQRLNLLQKHAGTFLPKVLWLAACLFWKRMSFFQRLYHISFFPMAVGCILPAIKGYIAHPFVFQMFVFSQAVCHNLFFKGCRQPFFAKAAGNLFCKGCGLPFPHLLPFFQRFYFGWNLPQSFFPKEPPFFQRLPFLHKF